jgi:hypothetical protein
MRPGIHQQLRLESALMNTGQPASFGRNSCAKVVFPAPFGPAMMTIFLSRFMAF